MTFNSLIDKPANLRDITNMQYTKDKIKNNIRKVLEAGKSNADALDLFLRMNMLNDLGLERPFIKEGPSPSDVHMHLIGNDVIDEGDFKLEMTKGKRFPTQRLVVKLSPTCMLYADKSYCSLQATINEKIMTTMYLKSYRAEEIALWIIRQKQKLAKYMEGWDAVLDKANKEVKSKRMAYLGIRAKFTEAMKDYPQVKYEFVEQKMRVRIKVMIPHTDVGVFLDAWWGSYRERLPIQIESLKLLLDAHSKSTLTNFFVHH